MEESIEVLEIAIDNSKYSFENFGEYESLDKTTMEAIENLIKGYKELEEQNKQLTDAYLIQKDLINAEFLKDYVSKDKIKAKLKELEKDKEGKDKSFRLYSLYDSYDIQIDTLKELLKEG